MFSLLLLKLALWQMDPLNSFILLCSHYDIMFIVSAEQKGYFDLYNFVATHHIWILLGFCFSTIS